MSKSLIQIQNFSKIYGSLLLFDHVSLSIHDVDRLALVGENGSGKSSILKILAGKLLPDSGRVILPTDLSIGYLPQELPKFSSTVTVKKFLENAQLKKLEQQMAESLEDPDRLGDWADMHEQYEHLGGYEQVPLESTLAGLKLDLKLLDEKISRLSGGEKLRIALAKALIENPNVLLLDEPTNHLDLEMVQWLENMILNRHGATLIVSHDRMFINNTCNRLVEIKDAHLQNFGGNYDFYLAEKKRQEERQLKAYEAQEDEKKHLKQEIKAITFSKKQAAPAKDRNKLGYNQRGEKHQKSLQRNLDNLKQRLNDLEVNPIPHPRPKTITGLRFLPHPLNSTVAIELKDVSKSFGAKTLFSEINKMLCKGKRIILTGANGSGKTTLLRCIYGQIKVDKGKILKAPTTKIGYLDQEVQLLPMDQSPLTYFENKFNLTEEALRRELPKAALGSKELLHLPFASMSVGQRKRLALLALTLEKPNVLLLDEPTNHLDLSTLEALETALLKFEGAILAVSHDRVFIGKIATEIWTL
ncbi:MAG TPA: ABC-F family ATP-binding cassette domain-containing protein [Chlamydiales bacterium]|nr:ABC-F family ATP-binding cassette domain-containing protein [Chlamydiales bacterium]